MKNNLLNKYLLPSYIAAVLFIGVGGTATFFAKKDIQMAKNNPEKPDVLSRCRTTYFMCFLVIVASIIMAVLSAVKYPMVIRGKVKNITAHYLQELFVRYPEIRQYSPILEDSKKLLEVAAVACNGLTENEQKVILNFINKEFSKVNSRNYDNKMRKVESFIIDIVKKHAAADPEYMNKILMTIANTQKTDIAKTQQKVR